MPGRAAAQSGLVGSADALQRFRTVDPQATLSTLRVRLAFMHDRVWNRMAEGLKLAGLPE